MDPTTALSLGVPGILIAGLIAIWREWQRDRVKAEDNYTRALAEQREDARAMHQMAADIAMAAKAIAHINENDTKIAEILLLLKEKNL